MNQSSVDLISAKVRALAEAAQRRAEERSREWPEAGRSDPQAREGRAHERVVDALSEGPGAGSSPDIWAANGAAFVVEKFGEHFEELLDAWLEHVGTDGLGVRTLGQFERIWAEFWDGVIAPSCQSVVARYGDGVLAGLRLVFDAETPNMHDLLEEAAATWRSASTSPAASDGG